MALNTAAVENVRTENGVLVPAEIGFRQIIVTGPPDCGKSTLVRKLGGWPEEGYLDLAENNWWRARLLTFRPREVHLGLPFVGYSESHAVFDKEWVSNPSDVDLSRIQIPPTKGRFFGFNWKRRYAFDFQLPPVEQIYLAGRSRARSSVHMANIDVTRELIDRQLTVHENTALHLHRMGMLVYVRRQFQGSPLRIVECD